MSPAATKSFHELGIGVSAKDLILHIIGRIGAAGPLQRGDPLLEGDLAPLGYYRAISTRMAAPEMAGARCFVSRTGYTGEDGFEFFVAPAAAPGLWRALLAAGEPGMRMSVHLIPERGAGSGEIYLEVAAAVTTFILAGRYFEARAKGQASNAIAKLAELGAKQARVVRDGVETMVDPLALAPGNIVVVLPGEKIPADGTVVAGRSGSAIAAS